MKFNKNSRNALLAISIGDGCIDKRGVIRVFHCHQQKDYILWKHKYLKGLGCKISNIKEIDNNGFPGFLFWTSVSKWSKLLRRILYSSGSKNYFNRKLLNRLEPVHLAIWYMDDGGLSQKKRNGTVHANELMINTHTTKENNQVLIDYFNEVWGVKFNQYKNRGHYRLACGTKEARKFIKIVEPFIREVPSMYHKINIKSENS